MIGPRNLSDTDIDNLDERLSDAALTVVSPYVVFDHAPVLVP